MTQIRKAGCPTKFTPETKSKLLEAISLGAPYEIACNYARVDYTTFAKWRQKAERDNVQEFIDFFNDLKEAQGATALKWLRHIEKAMDDGTWQSAAWKLERRHYKHFSAHAPILDMNERLDKLEGETKSEDGSEKGSEEDNQ